MIYNTNDSIINGGDEGALQKGKQDNFSANEQSRSENNFRRNSQDNFNYSEQRRRSNTEGSTGNETNGKGQKYDNTKNLGNDRNIIRNQESENNSGFF